MKKFSIIPEPVSFTLLNAATAFSLSAGLSFEGEEKAENSIRELTSFLEEVFFLEPDSMGREKIRFEIKNTGKSEGYSLRVEPHRIVITGNDESGLFYGVQSLKQLLFQGEGDLPCMEIEDYPRFPVRGFMLDCARYFFTVDAVKQFIDMMALHKLNEFHWHLSDDQGFRCYTEKKLLLTEIGSYRSHTNFNSVPHQGFYTREDMLEVVSYAHSNHIKVIPEIDTPGHVKAMLAAYPDLACFPREFTVSCSWGIRKDVLCIGKESTFTFMQELFDELVQIFTDGTVHLGGDEVPTERWKICPECQKRIKSENLTDESELHTYYLNRMTDYLNKKGIRVRMWNDSIKKNPTDKALTWQLWNNDISPENASNELNSGRKFIISHYEHYYLSRPYALTDLQKCYSYEPSFDSLTKKGEENILGVEGCLWSEMIPDMLTADKMTYPRLAAICESAWSKKENKDYTAFLNKLEPYSQLLFKLGTEVTPVRKTCPKGLKKLTDKLWWGRKKLCNGFFENKVSDLQIKNFR